MTALEDEAKQLRLTEAKRIDAAMVYRAVN